MFEKNYFNLILKVFYTDFTKLIYEAIEAGSIYSEIYHPEMINLS